MSLVATVRFCCTPAAKTPHAERGLLLQQAASTRARSMPTLGGQALG